MEIKYLEQEIKSRATCFDKLSISEPRHSYVKKEKKDRSLSKIKVQINKIIECIPEYSYEKNEQDFENEENLLFCKLLETVDVDTRVFL